MAQKFVNEWANKLQVYKLLHQYVIKIFDYTISLELIDKNPFSKVIRPKVKKTRPEKEIKFYTREQVGFILNDLEKKVTQVNNSNFLYKYFAEWDLTLYRTLAFTGIRGGEALSLLWDDINYYKKR